MLDLFGRMTSCGLTMSIQHVTSWWMKSTKPYRPNNMRHFSPSRKQNWHSYRESQGNASDSKSSSLAPNGSSGSILLFYNRVPTSLLLGPYYLLKTVYCSQGGCKGGDVLGPPRLACHTWWCPCFSVVLESAQAANRGPSKGAVSAQKALQGSETETRELLGGTEENTLSLVFKGHDL